MELFIVEHKELISVCVKMVSAVVVCVFGGRLFVKFIYNFSLKYFEDIRKESGLLREDIKELYGKFSAPDSGVEHRLTRIETLCGVCFKRGKK